MMRKLILRIWTFLRFVWREDFFGDHITIKTAWEVARIYYPEEKP
jgi:hypothetical protein